MTYLNSGLQSLTISLSVVVDMIDRAYNTSYSDNHYNPNQGSETGLKDVDDRGAVLDRGFMTLILGAHAMGKSAFVTQIALNYASIHQGNVAYFSPGDPASAVTLRMLSSTSHIEIQRYRTGNIYDHEWKTITSAVDSLTKLKISIDDTAAIKSDEIFDRSINASKEYQLKLIIVDDIQSLYIDDQNNRHLELSAHLHKLNMLARRLQIPVIVTGMLQGDFDERNNCRPTMSDVRRNGDLHQYAENVLLMYRDEVYVENSSDRGLLEIITAQSRTEPRGTDVVRFLGQFARLEDYTPLIYTEDKPEGL